MILILLDILKTISQGLLYLIATLASLGIVSAIWGQLVKFGIFINGLNDNLKCEISSLRVDLKEYQHIAFEEKAKVMSSLEDDGNKILELERRIEKIERVFNNLGKKKRKK